jgi:ribosomal protein S12 methylthiotransferase
MSFERYKPDLVREIPDVDQYFGTRDLPVLLKHLGADYKHELVGKDYHHSKHYAYLKFLKVATDLVHSVQFLMRGGHVSTPIEKLVTEAQKLAKKEPKN